MAKLKTNELLIEKSKEAFLMAIEIYNKPTIKYRVEGFSFFICNAWELMLKAYLIQKNGEPSIYYKNGRTLSLEACIKKIFTNNKDPLRKNLESIIDLRNTATHFITEDYEQIYAPLFQANIINFVNKANKLVGIDVTENIDQHFLSLSVNVDQLDDNVVKSKYSPQIAQQIFKQKQQIVDTDKAEKSSTAYQIPIEHQIYITKNKKNADLIVSIVKDSDTNARIIKQLKDPTNTHPYSFGEILSNINNGLSLKNIKLYCNAKETNFNSYYLELFIKFYNIKDDSTYCFKHYGNKSKTRLTYTYSQKLIDFVMKELKKEPKNKLDQLKKAIKKS